MDTFDASLYARPDDVQRGPEFVIAGGTFVTLSVPPGPRMPFAVSFEEAAAALSGLERMFFEPDGSFVWVSQAGEPAWQVDGVLYDDANRLQLVELKGCCPAAELERLLRACGWPATPVMFQLRREGVFLDETEFRRLAGQRSPRAD